MEIDIFVVFDVVLVDGVDIVFFSIGGFDFIVIQVMEFVDDVMVISVYNVVKCGVFVFVVVGNDGFNLWMVENVVLWFMIVVVVIQDRENQGNVFLGDVQVIIGRLMFDGMGMGNVGGLLFVYVGDVVLYLNYVWNVSVCEGGVLDLFIVLGKQGCNNLFI